MWKTLYPEKQSQFILNLHIIESVNIFQKYMVLTISVTYMSKICHLILCGSFLSSLYILLITLLQVNLFLTEATEVLLLLN